MKFIIVGAFTWLQPRGGEDDSVEPEVRADEADDPRSDDRNAGCGEPEDGVAADLHPGYREGPGEADWHKEEEREEPKFIVFRLCSAMPGKTSRCTLEDINRMHVHRDIGGEFRGKYNWLSGPFNPTAVEGAIQEVKARIQRAVHGAGWGVDR